MKALLGLVAGVVLLGGCDTIYYYGDTARPQGDEEPVAAASCRELHERSPALADGLYDIRPSGGAVRTVYCDMTRDGGGWTLMTPDDLAGGSDLLATVDTSVDANGGYQVTVVPQVEGCGGVLDNPRHQVLFEPGFAWTHMRARYGFGGYVSCWSLFGDTAYGAPLDPNLVPFDADVDAIRDEVRMGGSAGDAYSGGGEGPRDNTRCDDLAANFWHIDNGFAERSAVVTLRRADLDQPAGPSTGTRCLLPNPATLWRISEIYVR